MPPTFFGTQSIKLVVSARDHRAARPGWRTGLPPCGETARLVASIEDSWGESLESGVKTDLLRLRASIAVANGEGDEQVRVLEEVLELDGNKGFNALTGTYGDLIEAGVIDPTKVVRSALQNAASIAGLMLTTNTLVTSLKEDGKKIEEALV